MDLISLIVVLAVVGLLSWAILQIPMPSEIKRIILVVIIVVLCLYILQAFGLIGGPIMRLGNVR